MRQVLRNSNIRQRVLIVYETDQICSMVADVPFGTWELERLSRKKAEF